MKHDTNIQMYYHMKKYLISMISVSNDWIVESTLHNLQPQLNLFNFTYFFKILLIVKKIHIWELRKLFTMSLFKSVTCQLLNINDMTLILLHALAT